MNIERFQTLLDTYGSDPSRWPVDDREAAQSCMAEPEAQQLLASANELDSRLAQYQTRNVDYLHDAILQSLPTPWMERVIRWLNPEDSLVRPAFAMALPLVVGIMIGFALPQDSTDTPQSDELYLLALETTSYE